MEGHIFVAFAFVIMLAIMSAYNHLLLKSADKRLSKANEMVLTLAHSADKLSESVSQMKELSICLKNNYEQRLSELEHNRDDLRDAYTKLLHKYENLNDRIINNYDKMKDESFHAMREMATKPTISNSNNTDRI